MSFRSFELYSDAYGPSLQHISVSGQEDTEPNDDEIPEELDVEDDEIKEEEVILPENEPVDPIMKEILDRESSRDSSIDPNDE